MRRALLWVVGDHPRMRGEHWPSILIPASGTGSSPHARGTLQSGRCGADAIGIIPACAGNTKFLGAVLTPGGDHPRMRGEHGARQIDGISLRGSSPHARGTRKPLPTCVNRTGIIPACAGNTGHLQATVCEERDHPRMRGEHEPWLSVSCRYRGSSPHARGTLALVHSFLFADGIIPACAGNT